MAEEVTNNQLEPVARPREYRVGGHWHKLQEWKEADKKWAAESRQRETRLLEKMTEILQDDKVVSQSDMIERLSEHEDFTHFSNATLTTFNRFLARHSSRFVCSSSSGFPLSIGL